MPFTKSALISAAIPLALALAAPAQAQLISHKDLPFAMALTIATGALADCKARGYPVSAVVVDRAGVNIVALRDDGASPHTTENARRKAYTALTFKMTTEAYVKALEANPA